MIKHASTVTDNLKCGIYMFFKKSNLTQGNMMTTTMIPHLLTHTVKQKYVMIKTNFLDHKQ